MSRPVPALPEITEWDKKLHEMLSAISERRGHRARHFQVCFVVEALSPDEVPAILLARCTIFNIDFTVEILQQSFTARWRFCPSSFVPVALYGCLGRLKTLMIISRSWQFSLGSKTSHNCWLFIWAYQWYELKAHTKLELDSKYVHRNVENF